MTVSARTLAFGAFLSLSGGLGSIPTIDTETLISGSMEPTPTPDVQSVAPKVQHVDTIISFDEKDVECLALNIYHEARSEPEPGRLAVAAVTLNRVHSSAYPDTVCAVVKQGGQELHRCQFSWWCDGKSDAPTERRAWRMAVETARLSLLGLAEDPTQGATHYHATYVNPFWADAFEQTVQIGQHRFYRSGTAGLLQLASNEPTGAS